MKEESNGFVRRLGDILFPPKCVCCKSLLDVKKSRVLCESCKTDYALARRLVCRHCGKEMQSCTCCGDILIKQGIYRVARVVAYYPERDSAPEHALLYAAKRKRLTEVWKFIALEMAASVRAMPESPEGFCVTYVPRRPKSVNTYGFDHAKEISKLIAEELCLPWEETLCRDPRSKEQKGLTRKEREDNAANTILPVDGLCATGRRYIIVDDILTSGASLAAASGVLKALGAKEVRCAVFAYRG